MYKTSLKQKIIAVLILVVVMSVIIFLWENKRSETIVPPSRQTPETTPTAQDDSPRIISTKPDPLDDTIIPADQVIEIAFNRSLQNAPEFKVRIEPKIDFKVELSGDRKTARIIPVKPYQLGASYTLYINPDTKFDGMGDWGETKTFHFRTIKYRGI